MVNLEHAYPGYVPIRILMIDDDELVLESFFALAQSINPEWIVETANNHSAGLALACLFKPHVICCNIGRNSMPGLYFAERVRRNCSIDNIFLIAITGWSGEISTGLILSAGFDLKLTKPVSYDELSRHIRAYAIARSFGQLGS